MRAGYEPTWTISCVGVSKGERVIVEGVDLPGETVSENSCRRD
jgi:hypothetical protein